MFEAKFLLLHLLLPPGVFIVLPAGYRSWKGKTCRWADYLPSADGLFQYAMALREYIALACCRIA